MGFITIFPSLKTMESYQEEQSYKQRTRFPELMKQKIKEIRVIFVYGRVILLTIDLVGILKIQPLLKNISGLNMIFTVGPGI